MKISRTPELIRGLVPEQKMRRTMRWLMIFCAGFFAGQIISNLTEEECAAPVVIEDKKNDAAVSR